jgi:hypothetical protein
MTNSIIAAAEIVKAASTQGLSITLDLAALLSALLWPIVLLVVFLAYRKEIPTLVKGISSRLSKLEFAGVSIELAVAKAFVPEWSEAAGALDLRHKAQAGQVTDSYMMTFRNQLLEEGNWDYAEVDLGNGREWLTSRLFIMAIVFARMKGVKSLVFLKTSGNLQKRFVCWAEPQKVRWALAKRFPWLEQAYADANATLHSQYMGVIVSNEGRLGTKFDPADPEPGISLIREFLTRVQAPAMPVPAESSEWTPISSAPSITYEHARWLSSLELEDMLGVDCNKVTVLSKQLSPNNVTKQLRTLLSVPSDFVAVATKDHRFEYLVDRKAILEQVAKQLASQPEERT